MSRIWAKIEKPELVTLKNIIIDQKLSNSIYHKCGDKNEKIGKNLQVNFGPILQESGFEKNFIKIDYQSDSIKQIEYGYEYEDDVEIIIRGAWEKFDCCERHVIPHPSEIPKQLEVKSSEIPKQFVQVEGKSILFTKDHAFKLLLNLPDFQKLQNVKKNLLNSANIMKQLEYTRILAEFHATMDAFTFGLINKAIIDNVLASVDALVSYDSLESFIFYARANEDYVATITEISHDFVLKIFKRTIHTYKPRQSYYHFDINYYDQPVIKDFQRKTLNALAKKEFTSLKRLAEAGVHCSQPVMLLRHIVIMSFIGDNKKPAPKLKDAWLSHEELARAYNEVKEAMEVMYKKLGLVHTDFLENNILWFKKHCYVIDFSHATEITDYEAFNLLMGDCESVTRFFKKKRVPNILTKFELFQYVTGFDYNNKLVLEEKRNALKKI